MNMKMLAHIGFLCIVKILKLFTLTVLQLNMFLKKSKKKNIGHKNIKINTFRIQAHNSIVGGNFCIGFYACK